MINQIAIATLGILAIIVLLLGLQTESSAPVDLNEVAGICTSPNQHICVSGAD